MDPTESPELRALFRQELEERSSELVRAATELRAGSFESTRLDDVIRHAHTIKGSARLIGDDDVATAAATLEERWRSVRDNGLDVPDETVDDLVDIAARLNDVDAAAYADAYPANGSSLGPSGDGHRDDGSSPGDRAMPTGATGAAPTPDPVADDALAVADTDATEGALGGLLSSVTSSLTDGVTRVDTGELYRLINRLVEVALDSSAISDLALVNLEGADPKKVLAAWRTLLERLTASIVEVQERAVALANISFRDAVETFPQFIRYLGRKLDKDVRFELTGENLELDRQIVDQLREPLRHLLVNAVDHGIESPEERREAGKPSTGTVSVRARVVDDRVQISIADDGRGIDWDMVGIVARERGIDAGDDLTPVLLRPDFTTRDIRDDFSGGGEGLSIVADVVERLHGGLQVTSDPGRGTTVLLTLPISLVLQNMVVVAVGDQFWGLPEASVVASMALADPRVRLSDSGRTMRFEGNDLPVLSLTHLVGVEAHCDDQEIVVVSGRAGTVAVTVPEIVDRRRVAVKDLGPILDGTPHVTAAAFLGGGEVLVVLDPNYLADVGRRRPSAVGRRPGILVVDDSAGVRQLIAASLSATGFDVIVAGGAREAVQKLSEVTVDALVVDYSMPRSSGVDLVRALRAANVTVPIVMVSGVATPEEQEKAWESGVDAYMDKYDLRKGVLTTTLRSLLEDSVGSTA